MSLSLLEDRKEKGNRVRGGPSLHSSSIKVRKGFSKQEPNTHVVATLLWAGHAQTRKGYLFAIEKAFLVGEQEVCSSNGAIGHSYS